LLATPEHDVVIVGAGIIGLATARALERRFPGIHLRVIEKEDRPGFHQTGHNSGVIHSGLYYRAGSLKARLCVDGRKRMLEFCDDEGIPVGRYGKLVVATNAQQQSALDNLWSLGRANGLSGLEKLDPAGIRAIEPNVTGIAALRVPEAAVTDFSAVAERMAASLEGEVQTGAKVDVIEKTVGGVRVGVGEESHTARVLINCAGLHADRIARLSGAKVPLRIIPFRGEYYVLKPSAEHLVKGLVYPVPDPRFPFLGVHFTRKVDGTVEVGPNAVLALAREHYRGTLPSLRDLWDTATYPGFWRIVSRYWRTGTEEMWHSLRTKSYARLAQLLVPAMNLDDLQKGGAGVRAQAVGRDGRLLDDFEILSSEGAIHVLNAPSPAATSSLAIGDYIADLAGANLKS
jgi:L-2-hydroxyglutarate oxidase LhgO